MASAANVPSEQENRDPDRPRITRRNRGDCARNTPLDLEYLQRPSYCDAGFALEQISEVPITHLNLERAFMNMVSLYPLKNWPNYVQSLLGNGTGWGTQG